MAVVLTRWTESSAEMMVTAHGNKGRGAEFGHFGAGYPLRVGLPARISLEGVISSVAQLVVTLGFDLRLRKSNSQEALPRPTVRFSREKIPSPWLWAALGQSDSRKKWHQAERMMNGS